MVAPIIGAALIGGALGLVGAKSASNAQKRANDKNIAYQKEANQLNFREQRAINQMNIDAQLLTNQQNIAQQRRANTANRNFVREINDEQVAMWNTSRQDARNAIRYTVADAERAGINPLTAIKSGQSYSGPQAPTLSVHQNGVAMATAPYAEMGAAAVAPNVQANTAMGQGLANFGTTLYNGIIDHQQAQRDAMANELMRQEIVQRQQEAAPIFERDFGYSIPAAVTQTEETGLYGPRVSGDTSLTASDGLPVVNPDLPVEFEGDFWAAIRAGKGKEFIDEISRRNIGSGVFGNGWERGTPTWAKPLSQSFSDAAPHAAADNPFGY